MKEDALQVGHSNSTELTRGAAIMLVSYCTVQYCTVLYSMTLYPNFEVATLIRFKLYT
jgi:hypothetical protein